MPEFIDENDIREAQRKGKPLRGRDGKILMMPVKKKTIPKSEPKEKQIEIPAPIINNLIDNKETNRLLNIMIEKLDMLIDKVDWSEINSKVVRNSKGFTESINTKKTK